MPITQSGDLYHYRSYLETLLTYVRNAAASHLTNSFWNQERGDMLPCDPSTADKTAAAKNLDFITRWDKIKQSNEVQLYGRLPSDFCNVPKFLFPGLNLHFKLTKAFSSFYLMNPTADCTTTFKFLDEKLFVKRITANPDILSASNTTLRNEGIARYNLARVELKTFTIAPGLKSLSIGNLVLGHIPKRNLFTMVKNTYFLGSMSTNHFNFRN